MGGDAPGLSARLLREIVRTPAARELLAELLQPPGADAAAALTRVLLAEDPALGAGGLAALPELVNASMGVLDAVGRSLESLPPPLLAQAAGTLADKVDSEALAAAAGRWRRIVGNLAADPELRSALAEALARATNSALARLARLDGASLAPAADLCVELLARLNFGRLRVAAEALAAAAETLLPRVVDRAVSDPVLVANLVETGPPVTNAALGLAARVVDQLRLPPEVLASALFNLIEALDTGALARLVNGVSRLLAAAHEGNLVLGRHEPRLRHVLGGALTDLAGQLDRESAARAAVALAEDVETVLRTAGDLLYAEPELLILGLSGALFAADAALRGGAAAAEKLAGLPVETLERAAQELTVGLERLLGHREEIGALLGRLSGPALRLARRELDGVDGAQAGRAIGRVLSASMVFAARRPGLVEAVLAELEREETRRAVEAGLRELGAGLASRPRLLRALLGPLAATAQSALLDFVRDLPRRVRKRRRR